MRLNSEKARRLIHGIALGRHPPEAKASGRRGTKALIELRQMHASWWNHTNVVGLCLARKLSGGALGPLALQVLVRQKLAKRRLAAKHRIPESIEGYAAGIPASVPTDVRAVGRGRLEVLVSADRPARPGYNAGGRRSGSGTLTCAVRTRDGQEKLGLSCGHVVARFGQASPGERVLVPSYENAVADDLLADAPFGTLVTVLPIGFADGDATRNVDAATFRPDDPQTLDDTLAILGMRPSGVRSSVPLGLAVRKVGYATELTYGVIQALHVLVSLPYPRSDGGGDAIFADQIGVSSFTQPGDSGALVLDETGAAVGMHFASFDGMSICTPMPKVLDAVGCDLA